MRFAPFVLMAMLSACQTKLDRDALEGRPCPCIEGYRCDPEAGTCHRDVRGPEDASGGADAGHGGASPAEGGAAGASSDDGGLPSTGGSNAGSATQDGGPSALGGAAPDAGPEAPDASDKLPDASVDGGGGGSPLPGCGTTQTPAAPASCPSQCDSCDGGTCVIVCNTPSDCQGRTVACPEGMACRVECTGDSSCEQLAFDCPSTFACELDCGGRRSCSGATQACGDGPCVQNCSGAQACSNTALLCGSNSCQATCRNGLSGPLVVGCAQSCSETCGC